MNYYHNIYTLPVLNWDIINKTNDLSYLLKSPELKQPTTVCLEDIWNRIYTEFIEVFGMSEKQKEYFRLRKKWSDLMAQSYLDGKKHLITFAKIEEMKVNDLLKSIEGGDLSTSCAAMSKFMGQRINPANISVYEFFSNIKLMNQNNG